MLQGNINRMMVSDDAEEINEMYCVAKRRLAVIHTKNTERVRIQTENMGQAALLMKFKLNKSKDRKEILNNVRS